MSKLAQVQQIADKYRTDPHVWGRTKQVAGGLLVADGLVGLENPLDGKKTRPGILGSLLPLIFGLVFVVVGFMIIGGAPETDAETAGQITHVGRGGDTCSLTASYQVNGQTYTASSFGSSSGNCNRYIGEQVTVEYQSAHPEIGNIKGGKALVWLFPLLGGIVFLAGLGTFLIRLASIVGGAFLFFSGRKQANLHPDSNGNAAAAVAEAKQEITALLVAGRRKIGQASPHVPRTVGGVIGAGALGGNMRGAVGAGLGSMIGGMLADGDQRSAPTTAPTTAPAPTATATAPTAPASVAPPTAPAPVAPPVAPPVVPVGWYPTADGQWERYWDGVTWTDQVRPAA